MAKKFTFGVYIGRFQPFHNGHLELIKRDIGNLGHLIILVGSASRPRDIRNPWTFEERAKMITDSLTFEGIPKNKFTIRPVRDFYYNETKWFSDVQSIVMSITKGNEDIALLGHIKDTSSYYLKLFPNWHFLPSSVSGEVLDATTIRKLYFETSKNEDPFYRDDPNNTNNEILVIRDLVPQPVFKTLVDYKHGANNWGRTEFYRNMIEEYQYIQKYKEDQKKFPWPITFVTVDAVVVRSGHILVIKRKDAPGKGLYAIPGGFIAPEESIEKSTLRELREETGILLLPHILEDARKETRVFDYPGRSLRGRVITHATLFDLGGGQLPQVKGADDAAEALWIPVNEVMEHPELFFEDHFDILYSFLMRY
jgi:bifunctional NMN adenylyltransferase/nudix hydrolase